MEKENIFFITGFKPFDNIKENPSELLANSLDIPIDIEVLPVNTTSIRYFDRVKTRHNFKDYTKNFIFLHFGLSLYTLKNKIEIRAKNEYQGRAIKKNLSKYEETKINVRNVTQHLNVKISLDAGVGICNYLYYHSLRFTRHAPNLFSLFIHIPHHNFKSIKSQVIFTKELIKRIDEYFKNYKDTVWFLESLIKKFINNERSFKLNLTNSIKGHDMLNVKCITNDKLLIELNIKNRIPEILTRFSYQISKNKTLRKLNFVVEEKKLFLEWKHPFEFEYQGGLVMVLNRKKVYSGEHIINNKRYVSISLEFKDGINLALFLTPKFKGVLTNNDVKKILNEQQPKYFDGIGIPRFNDTFKDLSGESHKFYFNNYGVYDSEIITKPRKEKKPNLFIVDFTCILIHKPIFTIIVKN